jgi:UDP-N-acetylenolpyruvoylglucosamine reductase
MPLKSSQSEHASHVKSIGSVFINPTGRENRTAKNGTRIMQIYNSSHQLDSIIIIFFKYVADSSEESDDNDASGSERKRLRGLDEHDRQINSMNRLIITNTIF